MKMEYRMADTSTLKGLQEAERLFADGWTVSRVGLFCIWFFRKVKR